MNIKLKPRPFCGGEAVKENRMLSYNDEFYMPDDEGCECLSCGVITRKQTVEAWNTRTDHKTCRDCRWWDKNYYYQCHKLKDKSAHCGPNFGCIYFVEKL